MPSISSLENVSNNQFTHLLDLIRESSSKKDLFKSSVMDQMYISIMLAKSLLSNYDEIVKDANEIIKEIDNEAKNNQNIFINPYDLILLNQNQKPLSIFQEEAAFVFSSERMTWSHPLTKNNKLYHISS